jgi:hypothetical protein
MQEFVDIVADVLRPFVDRLTGDSAFRSGCFSAFLAALVIGYVSRKILYFWNRVLQFFKPTQKPATNPGPSPFNTCVGAIFGLLVLAGLAILALLVINELV